MSFLRYPRLPQGKVTHVLVSGEYPWLKESLEQEQHTKEEINGRIDTLLSTIREFTAEA